MSMVLTIQLPDELADQFVAPVSEDERMPFSIEAISKALEYRKAEEDDCVTVVEQALDEMDAGIGLVSFDDVWIRRAVLTAKPRW